MVVVVLIVAVAPGKETVRAELLQPNLTIQPSIQVEQRVNCILSVKARFAFTTKATTKIQEE